MIIGLIGGGIHDLPAGMRYPTLAQGKDEVANHLAKRGFQRVAFADNLKRQVADAYGTTIARLEDRALKETAQDYLALVNCGTIAFQLYVLKMLDEDIAGLSLPRSPRTIAQLWGGWRREQDTDYWLKEGLAQVSGAGDFIITDVRMKNEAFGLREQGAMLVRLVRPGTEVPYTGAEHLSETDLLDFPADGVIVNIEGDFEALHRQADAYQVLAHRLAA